MSSQVKEEEKKKEISLNLTVDEADPFRAITEELRLLRILNSNMDKVLIFHYISIIFIEIRSNQNRNQNT